MEEKEFIKSIKKVSDKRVYKVTNSLGVYDAYKYYRKNKPKDKKFILSESQYFAIIRRINELAKRAILSGQDIELPCRMGRIEVRKYLATITIKDNKVITNLPIDWNSTLKLWYSNKDSYNKRDLVRMNESEIFRVCYNKSKAVYNNKSFYQYTPNRELKLGLKHAIKENNFDAFIIS